MAETWNFYTPSKVEKLLRRPFANGVRYGSVREVNERVPVPVEPSERTYTGGWYWQRREPSCTPWSIANAAYSLEQAIDSQYLATILNMSLKYGLKVENGLSHKNAHDIFYMMRSRENIKMDFLPSWESLGPFTHKKGTVITPGYERQYRKRRIASNARTIKEHLDQDHRLVVPTYCEKYVYEAGVYNERQSSHSVCIAGYKAYLQDGNTFMDIDLIDSNLGVHTMPVELLFDSLVHPDAIVVRRRAGYYIPFKPKEDTKGIRQPAPRRYFFMPMALAAGLVSGGLSSSLNTEQTFSSSYSCVGNQAILETGSFKAPKSLLEIDVKDAQQKEGRVLQIVKDVPPFFTEDSGGAVMEHERWNLSAKDIHLPPNHRFEVLVYESSKPTGEPVAKSSLSTGRESC